jgi:hypothetical protein
MGAKKNNMLRDAERWQVHKWLDSLGADASWKATADDLANRCENATKIHVTAENMLHARRIVFPRVTAPTKNGGKLGELERRIEALESRLL